MNFMRGAGLRVQRVVSSARMRAQRLPRSSVPCSTPRTPAVHRSAERTSIDGTHGSPLRTRFATRHTPRQWPGRGRACAPRVGASAALPAALRGFTVCSHCVPYVGGSLGASRLWHPRSGPQRWRSGPPRRPGPPGESGWRNTGVQIEPIVFSQRRGAVESRQVPRPAARTTGPASNPDRPTRARTRVQPRVATGANGSGSGHRCAQSYGTSASEIFRGGC